MKAISDRILRAKSWQIFCLFAIWCVADVIVMMSVTANDLPFWVVSGLFGFLFYFWFWSLGSFLNSVVHPRLRLRYGVFCFAVVYPALYVLAFMLFLQNHLPMLFAVVIPLHLLAMFCMIYPLYFISKNLVLAETGKSASFSDYVGPFFLFWFFPVGVWFVQPRINRLYADRYVKPPENRAD